MKSLARGMAVLCMYASFANAEPGEPAPADGNEVPPTLPQEERVITTPSPMSRTVEWTNLQPFAEPERERLIGVSVGLGVAWLGNGEPGEQPEPTTFMVLNARVARAFTELLYLKGQLAVGRTGDARFEDFSFSDMDGVLRVNAILGQAQMGGSLRFGQHYAPYARFGLGIQGSSYDATFLVAGSCDARQN